MSNFSKEIIPIEIEQEIQQAYLDYAMSVIIRRALPDVRDGLKPVHRRILYAMYKLGNYWNKNYKKSARIVGDVIGKYHPHGENSVYDAIVRMAQNFSLRYKLIDGQGNFGSIDGDPPAAMRYTEIRMSKISHEIIEDIEKDTVHFLKNYDDTEEYPSIMPAKIPNLLINGSSGIAVGMVTNIPPHNIKEVINGILSFIKNPQITITNLINIIPGPDFPTGASINGLSGIVSAYNKGKGKILVRGKAIIEYNKYLKKKCIEISELPYQINKTNLIEKIIDLIKNKKIIGINEIRDESNKEGMSIIIEIKKNAIPEIILNNLYKKTQLASFFNVNMIALVKNQPKLLNLKQLIEYFVFHRREIVYKKTIYELRKYKKKAHIIEGIGICLNNIDQIINFIKKSKNANFAKINLLDNSWNINDFFSNFTKDDILNCKIDDKSINYDLDNDKYYFSKIQVQSILDMKLNKLTNLEKSNIFLEYKELIKKIKYLIEILSNNNKLTEIIYNELKYINISFSDARKTKINSETKDLIEEDLIKNESLVVTLSYRGYIKTQLLSEYQSQKRGGKGKTATIIKETDFIEKLLVVKTHDTLLCFSSLGKIFWIKVYQISLSNRLAKGKPIINLLPLKINEKINEILPIQILTPDKSIFMATKQGIVKRVNTEKFKKPRSTGIIAIKLMLNDKLIGVSLINNQDEVMLFTNKGKSIRFASNDVRIMGRNAIGVKGITLNNNQQVISLIVINKVSKIFTTTSFGYGKCTKIKEYSKIKRAGKGVINIQTSNRNGDVVGVLQISSDKEELMLISNKGTLIRIPVKEIPVIGRNTQGVKLFNLTSLEKLVSITSIKNIN